MSSLDERTGHGAFGDSLEIHRGPALSRAGFAHGFTTRRGGVSKPPFESLDFALERDPGALAENRARLARVLEIDKGALHQAVQVHGSAVVVVGADPRATIALEADALVAEGGARRAVGVRVADCVPVLVGDPATGSVAAIHAGWRGVELEVIAAGVRRVARSGDRLVAAIGPCIGPCCFEVGVDVAARIAKATISEVVTRTEPNGKAFVDLRLAVRAQLRALGLHDEAVDDVPGRGSEGCTHCDAARFYSYRRDRNTSGRLLGVIVSGTPRGHLGDTPTAPIEF